MMILAVLVSAAVSLKGPLQQDAERFRKASPGEEITFNFGASGQLAAQIEQGAPADLFLSASTDDVDRLAAAKRIDPGSRTVVATNRLVVVAPKDGALPHGLEGLTDPKFRRIAIGNPKTVPAGRYAQQALTAAGVFEKIEPRLVYAENVRQVAELVGRGEVDAGIVYTTDVTPDLAGTSVLDVPGRLHKPIVYEGAVVQDAKSAERARAFLEFLASEAGRSAFKTAGFGAPRPDPPR